MKTGKEMLITVLQEAATVIQLPENDFSWSSWEDATTALAEIQGIERQINNDDFSRLFDLSVIFAPTGPMQELSLSSGWGDLFLKLAERYDEAEKKLQDELFA